MRRLIRLFDGTGKREGDDVRAMCVAHVILENNIRTPAALFTAAAAKLHQIHVANLRNPLFVILKTQYAKPLKYNYVDGWSIARPIWQSQVNYIDNIKKYLTG